MLLQLLVFILQRLDSDSLHLLVERVSGIESDDALITELCKLSCRTGNTELLDLLLREGRMLPSECIDEAIHSYKNGESKNLALLLLRDTSPNSRLSTRIEEVVNIALERCDVNIFYLAQHHTREAPLAYGLEVCPAVSDVIMTLGLREE